MRYALFSFLLSFNPLIGTVHAEDLSRIPASVRDVGVIGPNGEVLLYYREGDFIIVKACETNTILGVTPFQARKSCEGHSNKVPVESFKHTIRNLISTDRLNILKPLTPEEVQAYAKDGPSSEEIEAVVSELEKINNFIARYGAENANLVRKEELVKALRSQETRVSAIKKIKSEIEKVVNLIANQTQLTLTKFNLDKDKFLYNILKQFNPNEKFPCGLKGSVDERMKDCAYQLTSSREGFVLVTRSKDFKEVYKEVSTGLLWSDRLPSTMSGYNAEKACKAGPKDVVGLSDVSWRLPSIDEYKEAEKSGIKNVLPNMNYWFWSSTALDYYPVGAWMYRGNDGYTALFSRSSGDDDVSVRCVAAE